jgi:hypothetical protein
MNMSVVDAGKRTLAEVLDRVAVELATAAGSVEDLHTLVEHTMSGAPQDDAFIRKVQTVDLLQQHLAALSTFVGALAQATPAAWMIDESAAKDVKLSGLRERLNSVGRSGAGAGQEDGNDAGDLQLFEHDC